MICPLNPSYFCKKKARSGTTSANIVRERGNSTSWKINEAAIVEGRRSGLEGARLKDADAGFDAFVTDALEGLQQSLQDHLSTIAGNGHADLLADGLLGSEEHEVIREGLKPSSLAVRKGPVFGPVVNVRAAATRTRDRVGRLVRVKTPVDLGKSSANSTSSVPGRSPSASACQTFLPSGMSARRAATVFDWEVRS